MLGSKTQGRNFFMTPNLQYLVLSIFDFESKSEPTSTNNENGNDPHDSTAGFYLAPAYTFQYFGDNTSRASSYGQNHQKSMGRDPQIALLPLSVVLFLVWDQL